MQGLFATLGISVFITLLAVPAALAEQQPSEIWQIDCASEPLAGRTHCPLPETAQRVSIAQQHSHLPCVFGESWGLADTTLWTAGGCAARFMVETGEMPTQNTDRPVAPEESRAPFGYVNGRFQRDA